MLGGRAAPRAQHSGAVGVSPSKGTTGPEPSEGNTASRTAGTQHLMLASEYANSAFLSASMSALVASFLCFFAGAGLEGPRRDSVSVQLSADMVDCVNELWPISHPSRASETLVPQMWDHFEAGTTLCWDETVSAFGGRWTRLEGSILEDFRGTPLVHRASRGRVASSQSSPAQYGTVQDSGQAKTRHFGKYICIERGRIGAGRAAAGTATGCVRAGFVLRPERSVASADPGCRSATRCSFRCLSRISVLPPTPVVSKKNPLCPATISSLQRRGEPTHRGPLRGGFTGLSARCGRRKTM